MEKKNNIINIIYIFLIAIFVISLVPKTFQNDTFFTIAIGERILEHGVENEEKLVWHEGLEFTNSRWIFDLLIAYIYDYGGFIGIYVFVLITTIIIGLVFYNVLVSFTQKSTISFIATLITMWQSLGVFTARAQILSFLLFIIEFYCLEKLMNTNKKIYVLILLGISILISNIHASVFPIYFVLYIPYIAEWVLEKLKLKKADDTKIIIQKRNIELLIIGLMLSFILVILATPDGVKPFSDMFKVMSGISTEFIAELQPTNILKELYFTSLIIIVFSIIAFTKVKVRVTDCFYILGLALLSLTANRCLFYFYLIASICIFRIISDYLDYYDVNLDFINKKIKLLILFSFTVFIILESVNNFIINIKRDFIDTSFYPVDATKYILNNLDVSNMKIYNHFDFGSYLEYKGIKAFIDSRSGIYTPEFNEGCDILSDWNNVFSGKIHYKKIFDKYKVTHALLYNDELIKIYISEDKEWKLLYQDDVFSLYEKAYQ